MTRTEQPTGPEGPRPGPVRALQQKLWDKVNPIVGFSVTRSVFDIGIFVGVVVFGFISIRSSREIFGGSFRPA